MKFLTACLIAMVLCAGCSTLKPRPVDPRLALYRTHAGAPVTGFRSLGRIDSWEALGDDALAIWTRPNEAWLLELYGPCDGLEFSVAIGLTDHVGRVEAGFDEVLVSNPSPIHMPCRIRSIRPLNVPGLRQAEKAGKPPAH